MGKARYILTFALWLGLLASSESSKGQAVNRLTITPPIVIIDINTAPPQQKPPHGQRNMGNKLENRGVHF